jgi:hypothetical protein
MMKTRMRRLLAAVLGTALLLSCAAKCDGSGGVDRSEHDPADQSVDPKRTMIANLYAHATTAPYEVIVDVYGEIGGHEGSHETIATTKGAYTQKLRYTSGRRVSIRIEVKPSRSPGGAFCSITDGSKIEKIGPVSDGWRAICELTTTR